MTDRASPIAIVGAGITGLVLAWRLMREGRDVVLLERACRAGGVIRSVRQDGILLETGAQTLLGSATNVLAVVSALGLTTQIVESAPNARGRFILWGGRPLPVPRTLLDPRFMPRGALLRAAMEPLVPRPERQREDESVFAFIARRFGRTIAVRLADPFVAGVFAGDARRIEVAQAFPDLTRFERTRGSVVLGLLTHRRRKPKGGPRRTWSFRNGLETLPSALAEALGGRLRLETPVEQIEPLKVGFRVHATGGPYEVSKVVCCLPPNHAASLFPELGAELAAMPRAPVASVHLAWPKDRVPDPPEGFGWLAPSVERRDVLGCLWVSSLFPEHAPGHVLMRVMLGGARDPALPAEPELIDRARAIVRDVQGIDADPSLSSVSIAHIPQYERGHGARMKRLQSAFPGLFFLGWGYTGVGVEHCTRAAMEVGVTSG